MVVFWLSSGVCVCVLLCAGARATGTRGGCEREGLLEAHAGLLVVSAAAERGSSGKPAARERRRRRDAACFR